MYLTVTSKKDSQTLQQDIQKLEQWEKTWEMHFNPSKCQVTRNPIQTQYVLHRKVLEAVDHANNLGLEIGHDLKWNHHVQNVTTKANRTFGYIRRNIRIKHKGAHTSDSKSNFSKAPARVCLPRIEPKYRYQCKQDRSCPTQDSKLGHT